MNTTPTEAAHGRCAPPEEARSAVVSIPMSCRPQLEEIAEARGVSVLDIVNDALVAYLGQEAVK